MITTNIITRVVRVRYANKSGTGFTIDHREKQYLISAKHIFPNIEDRDNIQYWCSSEWKTLKTKIIDGIPDGIDQIIFELKTPITPNLPVSILTQFEMAMEVFFLGFPYGQMMDDKGINNNFPLPYIKHGIISGAESEHKIYIDAHGNRGFSGGPLVIPHEDRNGEMQMNIIGVMAGYLFDKNEDGEYSDENSGISYAYGIKPVLECIEADFLQNWCESGN